MARQLRSSSILCLAIVLIHDVCGNLPPVFTQDMNNLALYESTSIGELVFTLEGYDPEGSDVKFGIIGTNLFSVDRTSGAVRVAKQLDREVNDTINFMVTIEDEVEPSDGSGVMNNNNIVKVPITVIVLDDNDNAPVFHNLPYEAEVDEDAAIGSTIFSGIVVADPDSVGETLDVTCLPQKQSRDACEKFKIVTQTADQTSYSGLVVLQQPLDYNEQQIYKFGLNGTDGTFNRLAVLEVRVKDVQNAPPVFQGSLTAIVNEDAPIGTLVMTLQARDGDRALPRKIQYDLVTNPMNYFMLNPVTGELHTVRPLDREALSDSTGVIPLQVRAREIVDGVVGDDPLTVTTTEVSVTVKDVDDSPPIFSRMEYLVTLPENTPLNTPLPHLDITVRDPDVGQNAVFSLRLDDISGVFDIEPSIVYGHSAVTIRVANGSLDYENLNQRKFIVLVIAEEKYTNPKLSSTATLVITVTDTNDNAPTFDLETYSASVQETAVPGTQVIAITANDLDSGQFGKSSIVYQLFGNGAERFKVDNKTGNITVAECQTPGTGACLDFESKPVYYLSYRATDDNGLGQSTVVPLRISLLDTNDSPPVCHSSLYRGSLDEGAVAFDPPLIVQAKDVDQTSKVSYKIVDGNPGELFSIDALTGQVTVTSKSGIDMSSMPGESILMSIAASDGMHSDICMVNITVRDVNNHEPTFTKVSYSTDIAENVAPGTEIEQVQAVDVDVGINSEIHYRIQKGGLENFAIDDKTGTVSVRSKLDYDQRNTYHIEIVATDSGIPSLTGTTTLTVRIINSNDKSPYFTPSSQRVEVPENAPVGTVIHTLTAMDPDVNTMEALNFAATEPITAVDSQGNPVTDTDAFKDIFSVDRTTGQVTVVKPLQRKLFAVVKITVLVTDTTAPTVQQGKGVLVITIMGVNALPPVFRAPWSPSSPYFTVQILEEQAIGSALDSFTATDLDSNIAGYTIVPESPYVTIENDTGLVRIARRIDFEEMKSFNFNVVVFDSGIPQLNSTARVTVTVVNTNDNDPVFSANEYVAAVSENAPAGTYVTTVNATDKDEGTFGDVTYSLIGEHDSQFNIDSNTGVIYVKNGTVLDREKQSRLTITAQVSDNAPISTRRSSAVPVNIEVLDENDNPPSFQQLMYHSYVVDNLLTEPPTPILQVKATDPDQGMNGTVAYQILKGNDEGLFYLNNEQGILFPAKSLEGHSGQYILSIEARDRAGKGPYSDQASITITVQSVNQHVPVFIMPALANATVEIPENEAQADYLIMTVKAVDKDQGKNGKISYHLKVNNLNVQETDEFRIDMTTGELTTKKFLDRQKSARHEVVLVARDQGNPSWHETLRFLSILIVDTNDHIPEFPDTSNLYHFFIPENSMKDIRFGKVKAVDMDEGIHALVYYYILQGNDQGSFYIDKIDGILYTNKTFDREEQDNYNIYVLASNEPDLFIGESKLSNQMLNKNKTIAKVLITIKDENDNPPKFQKPEYYAGISVMSYVNSVVTNVKAIDPDFDLNGTISYHIAASNLYTLGSNQSAGSIVPSPFSIGPTGRITTANFIAEYNQDRFVLEVVATEIAPPEREARALVHVWIFEPEQLIRVILSRPATEVNYERDEIINELSNATQKLIVVDEIRYHVDSTGFIRNDWCDIYLHAVNPLTFQIAPVSDVLQVIDAHYDFLKDYYAGFAIENVVPAYAGPPPGSFDPALAALIALLIVFFFGSVSLCVICCCLKHWVISIPKYERKKDALIKKQVIEDLNATENPLWIEQKLKLYEEQELTMQVFNDLENPAPTSGLLMATQPSSIGRNSNIEFSQVDNTYATINPATRRSSGGVSLDMVADYATLNAPAGGQSASSIANRDAASLYETAMGFQGSTFQVPLAISDINNDGQLEHVPELL